MRWLVLSILLAQSIPSLAEDCEASQLAAWEQVCLATLPRSTNEDHLEGFWAEKDFLAEYRAACALAAGDLSGFISKRGEFKSFLEPALACEFKSFAAHFEQCTKDALLLRPGVKRRELQQNFAAEPGVSVVRIARFAHKECSTLHMYIHFDMVREEDFAEDPDDVIVKVTGPYVTLWFPG